ncbi:MAG: aminotransferase class V-fold PLP-dependent enzyme [Minisyncoccia bacterium]
MFWNKRTYLDYAAGVRGNPSSPHEEGRRAKRVLEEARTTIARLVEVQPDDVIFTSGATESNALAILGVARALRARGFQNMHMLYLPSAHASIVENMKMLAEEGVIVEALPIREYRVDTEALAKMLRPETVLVSMDAVCGETGVVWNAREVAQVLRAHNGESFFSLARGTAATREEKAFPVVLHVDASQAPMTEKITRDHFGADLLTFDAAKIGDVRGIGALVVHRTIPLAPLYKGGGQERSLRAGTESPELAEKFAACLRQAALGHEAFRASASLDRSRLMKLIIGSVKNIGVQEGRSQAPHILNLSLVGRDTDYLVALLDEAGFAVSTRSACETDSEDGSRVVFALTGDIERARATLRISWGPCVSSRDLSRFASAFLRAVAFLDKSGQR